MIRSYLLSTIALIYLLGTSLESLASDESGGGIVAVYPTVSRAIQGVSQVERARYFSVADSGVGFDRRLKDDAMYDYLVHDLGITFGRSLGLVKYPASKLKEDPNRPGFADLGPLLKNKPNPPSEKMRRDFGPNFDVAMHGAHNAFPEFMGRFTTPEASTDPKHAQSIPQNIEAAALLSAAVLKHNYTDYDRPRYYELVNEPHWSFFKEQHLADWHLKTREVVKKVTPDVQVGGLCMSVSYFYRNNYKSFNGLRQFIDMTHGALDFYSFHTYDYLRWREGEFKGRLQSGLALEGTLDLVPNYTVNEYGKECGMVVSEQGGYNGEQPKGTFDGEYVASSILSNAYPNADMDSWDMEMKKRSIVAHGHVSSIVANTLAFMDHPHTLKKAVPFILVTTWNWGPKYYAQLYVAKDYTDEAEWVEQDMLNYYRFFRGVDGRRVKALCSDPDIQTRAFVHGSTLYLALNNQSFEPETIDVRGISAERVELRRLGRAPDFTMTYEETTVNTPSKITLKGREGIMLVADYGHAIPQRAGVDERVCYGDKIAVPVSDATFNVRVPNVAHIDYAQLRIAITRPPDASKTPIVEFNGELLDVPLEDCAERFVDKEYAVTKLVYVDPKIIKARNEVTVSFPDGDAGAVGSVVLRVATRR